MSEHRILLIENPAYLAIDLGRLRVRRLDFGDVYISPRDIAVLCLHHHTITLSVHVLKLLAEHGAMVIVTDEKHLPSAMLLPLIGNLAQPLRLRQQIAIQEDALPGELWRQIVHAKLKTQAAALKKLGRKGALRLLRLASQVQPGDKSKLEGQGARYYWQRLFPSGFRRAKHGADDPINARLNFGYAILRSFIARELVMAGLHPALGIGHANIENPFNLADDFIEPFRFLVDEHVACDLSSSEDFDREARKKSLGFVQNQIRMYGQDYRLPSAIAETVASYCRILDCGPGDLVLPGG